MNRKEHLEWAKKRTLQEVDRGNLTEAFASMSADLLKHEETAKLLSEGLGMKILSVGQHIAMLGTADDMRKWIDGFN